MVSAVVQRILEAPPALESRVQEIQVCGHWVFTRSHRPALASYFPGMPGLEDPSPAGPWIAETLGQPAREVARAFLASRDSLKLATGMSLLNSLLPVPPRLYDGDSLQTCAPLARRLRTAFIGHFPDAAVWRGQGWPVDIVELFPKPGDIHWDQSHAVLDKAELVLMTGLTLVNGTFEEVVRRTPRALFRVIMGPTVPLSPVFFDHGIHLVGSTLVEDAELTKAFCSQGGHMIRQAPAGALRLTGLMHPALAEALASHAPSGWPSH
jgi:hypothetical protein